MTIRLSTGLRNAMMTNYGLGIMMNYGRIFIYGGVQPQSPDFAPLSAPKLAVVSQDGVTPIPGDLAGGLRMQPSSLSGAIENEGDWFMRGLAAGTATWWRFVWNAFDDEGDSNFFPRIDGAVGESLILTTTSITPLTGVPVTSFRLILPNQ